MSSVAPIATMSLKGFKPIMLIGHLVRYAAQRPKEFCHRQVPGSRDRVFTVRIMEVTAEFVITNGLSRETEVSLAGISIR